MNFCRKDLEKIQIKAIRSLPEEEEDRGGGWPDSGEAGRRRRGPTGQGARGGRGEPVGGFGCGMGWPEGGRRRRAERGGGR